MGGDTDTVASMAGQIMGAGLGVSRLPGTMLDRLSDLELIRDVAVRFARAVQSRR